MGIFAQELSNAIQMSANERTRNTELHRTPKPDSDSDGVGVAKTKFFGVGVGFRNQKV